MLTVTPIHSSRGCLSYLVADEKVREAVIIDPSEEVALEQYLALLEKDGLRLVATLETHTHADHVSSGPQLRAATGAKIGMHAASPGSRKDFTFRDGDTVAVGTESLTVIETFGHTDESVSFAAPGVVFTGDALLIGGTGRTDFQAGDSAALYRSLWEKILALPDETFVYPAHNYEGRTHTTIGDEKRSNVRLSWSHDEFVRQMDALHPPKPDLFEIAIAKNSA